MALLLNGLSFVAGLAVVARTVISAIRTFVVPRAESDVITGLVFNASRRLFNWLAGRRPAYLWKDRVLAYYAPVTLIALAVAYLILVQLGFALMFRGVGVRPWYRGFLLSGSSLLTLGFAGVETFPQTVMAFTEATIGLILIALIIAYLPTIYSAFSNREKAVNMLEVRAGSPPTAEEMFARARRLERLNSLDDVWRRWEEWFVEVEESHTSLGMLVFFRSPVPHRHWLAAAGAVLDAAALRAAVLDLPRDVQAELCIRAGYLALRAIADHVGIPYDPDPAPGDPISITRAEFDAVCARLEAAGVPLRTDRAGAWRAFAGWRVNYDAVLSALARLTMPPPTPWVTDRQPPPSAPTATGV